MVDLVGPSVAAACSILLAACSVFLAISSEAVCFASSKPFWPFVAVFIVAALTNLGPLGALVAGGGGITGAATGAGTAGTAAILSGGSVPPLIF